MVLAVDPVLGCVFATTGAHTGCGVLLGYRATQASSALAVCVVLLLGTMGAHTGCAVPGVTTGAVCALADAGEMRVFDIVFP